MFLLSHRFKQMMNYFARNKLYDIYDDYSEKLYYQFTSYYYKISQFNVRVSKNLAEYYIL